MVAYADPELLISEWLHQQTGLKIYTDRDWQGNERFVAAFAHLQRSPGSAELPVTLDEVLFDCDVYAASADHARNAANLIWTAMAFTLPRTTFGNGVFVKSVTVPTKPCWAPDPKVNRRTAAYRVILHGVI